VLSAEGNVELPLLLTKLSSAQRKKNVAVALQVWGLPIVPSTSQRNCPVVRKACRDRARWCRPRCSSARADRDLDRKTADEILGLLQVLNREHGKTT